MTETNQHATVRILTRAQLIDLSEDVAASGRNYGRPLGWMESNIRPDAVIPLYVLGSDGHDRIRCVVVPKLMRGSRGRFSIDLDLTQLDALPALADEDAIGLVRELLEWTPAIPLTEDQEDAWRRAGYDWH
jgi:hypothetical protein